MMNDNFCSDIVSLFWNHLWECEDCFSKVFVSLVIFVIIFFTLFILYNMFVDWFEKRLDRLKYRREYAELESEFEKLNDSYSELLVDYYNVTLRCSDLEKKSES